MSSGSTNSARSPVVLATPFRACFALAALVAAAWMPLWLLVLFRGVRVASDLGPIGWHAHEMVFGYTGAVVCGFLLTAARNWTKRETASGVALGALVALWCAGRLVALRSGDLPGFASPALDGLFFAGTAAAALRAIVPARNWRNLALPLLVLGIGLCDVTLHLGTAGHLLPEAARRGLFLALDLVCIIMLIIGGRIIPLFTRNALGSPTRPRGALDNIGLATIAAAALSRFGGDFGGTSATSALFIAAGAVNLARLYGWQGSRTLAKPLLWVLHAGWLLVSSGLVLTGIAGFSARVPPTAATHLVTVGGIGVMTLGMMARVALGHTGRALAAPLAASAGFLLLIAAALIRVGVPIAAPAHSTDAWWLSGALWTAAFVLYAARYTPILLSPRADGKPG